MPSAVIHSIKYDETTNSLTIAFVSGLIYVYNNVPEKVYLHFKAYQEKGIYFNQHIKGKYPYKKLTQTL